MKKYVSVFLVLILTVMLSAPVNAEEDLVILSELTDQECLSLLKSKGLTIPSIYEEESLCLPFVRMVVEEVEANPTVEFTFGYYVLENFANEIKYIVIEHYCEYMPSTYVWSYDNILVDNTLHGTWKDEYVDYRCYSYVMGYDVYVQPGQIKWMLQGNEREDFVYNYFSANIQAIVGQVEEDLSELGYSYCEPTTTMPNTNVSQHTHLICVRKDNDTSGDYHFMKLGIDGYWYHKPGKTNPLKYNAVPEGNVPWTHEYYDGTTGRYHRYPNVTYEGEIYFIEYTTPHDWNYESVGINQHTCTCTICNSEETQSCEYEYTYFYDDMHNASCKYCDNGYSGAFCTFDYTSNGNGTHTGTCVCGNTQTYNCYMEYTNVSNTTHNASCVTCGYSVSSQPCTLTYEQNNGQTHTVSCTKCENSRTQDCSHTYVSHGDNTHSYLCSLCGYVKIDHDACLFNANNICRTCGAPKNGAVINKQEEITPE